jgi:hypothetical protein
MLASGCLNPKLIPRVQHSAQFSNAFARDIDVQVHSNLTKYAVKTVYLKERLLFSAARSTADIEGGIPRDIFLSMHLAK